MEVLTDASRAGHETLSALKASVRQGETSNIPDVYPQVDNAHIFPQLCERGLSGCQGEGTVVKIPCGADLGEGYKKSFESTPPSNKLTLSNGDAEGGDELGDTLGKLPSQKRPGVILLGRGNSFSLGRSEVIFLHNTRPARHRALGAARSLPASSGDSPGPASAPVKELSSNHQHVAADINHCTPNGPSPPPQLSNLVHPEGIAASRPLTIVSGKTTEEDVQSPVVLPSTFDKSEDLESLWCRAERVMCSTQHAVLGVLAQFGVGGGEEGALVEEEEEDGLWQVVERPAAIS